MKKVLVVVLMMSAGITAYAYYNLRGGDSTPQVRTSTVNQGAIVETIGATGTLEAVTMVQVGSQVSGTIAGLYADFNSIVHEGDVIARLDPSLLETQVEQSRANLVRAQADMERLGVAVDDAKATLARARDLKAKNLIPATEFEAAEVALRSSEAQLRSANAQVTQAEASLHQTEVNLDHTVITAPIDGIVISRSVDVGQTVAATVSAPELFVLAADLTEMQVLANIDESDVGRIQPGQPVTFQVDAYPNEAFVGTVSQVRLEAVVVQNVVTYATVIDVPNPDLRLKPGMTATVTIEAARRDDVIRIPNAALRFRPSEETVAVLSQPPRAGADRSRAEGSGRPAGAPGVVDESRARVWLYDGEHVMPVSVTLGLTDGSFTELLGGDIEPGAELVTGVVAESQQAAGAPSSSPLIPQRPGGRPR